MTSCQAFYCTNEKGKCEKNFFFVITGQDYPCQHIDQWPRKTRESTTALATKKKKACVRIKRVKTDSYLTYGHLRKKMKLYVIETNPPPQLQINSFVLW